MRKKLVRFFIKVMDDWIDNLDKGILIKERQIKVLKRRRRELWKLII